MSLPLKKASKLSLVKATQEVNVDVRDLKNAIVGVGWDVNSRGNNMDIDIMAVAHFDQSIYPVEKPKRLLGALFANSNRDVHKEYEVCYFAHKKLIGGAIQLDKDNTTGIDSTERVNGRCDDERIYINFDMLPQNCDKIHIGLCIYDNNRRNQTLADVNNLFLRLHVKGTEVFIAEISKKDIDPKSTAMHYITFSRDSEGNWNAELVEEYFKYASIAELSKFMETK